MWLQQSTDNKEFFPPEKTRCPIKMQHRGALQEHHQLPTPARLGDEPWPDSRVPVVVVVVGSRVHDRSAAPGLRGPHEQLPTEAGAPTDPATLKLVPAGSYVLLQVRDLGHDFYFSLARLVLPRLAY